MREKERERRKDCGSESKHFFSSSPKFLRSLSKLLDRSHQQPFFFPAFSLRAQRQNGASDPVLLLSGPGVVPAASRKRGKRARRGRGQAGREPPVRALSVSFLLSSSPPLLMESRHLAFASTVLVLSDPCLGLLCPPMALAGRFVSLRRGLAGRSRGGREGWRTARTGKRERPMAAARAGGGGKEGAPPPAQPSSSSSCSRRNAPLSCSAALAPFTCSTISIGSAPCCQERGHQCSRGSLGTACLCSYRSRALFFSFRAAVDRTFFRFLHHIITSSQTGPLVRHRPPPPAGSSRSPQAQAQEARAVPQLLLHGRQVPGMLPDHRSLLQLADGGRVPGVLGGFVHPDRREG